MSIDSLVLVGEISCAHGIKGAVKIRHFCESIESFMHYNPFVTDKGKPIILHKLSDDGKNIICRIDSVTSKNEADNLRGTKLFIERTRLPETDDEAFYINDLIGMECYLTNGDLYGKIIAVHNFGAGDIIEISESATEEKAMLSFSEETFVEINPEQKKVILNLPEYI